MEDTILSFLVCFHVLEQVHSQSVSPSSQGVPSVLEVSLLALVVVNVLLCITTITVVCLLHRHARKIWIKLSQKDIVLEDHIIENVSAASDSWKPEKDNSQTLTAFPSVKSPAGERRGSFRLNTISHSSQASTPRLFTRCSPLHCEDAMTQKARQSSSPERCPQKHFTVVDLTLEEDESGYVDMQSCYVRGPVLSTANESSYDIPRYASVGHLYSFRETQSRELLKRPKHSRYHSDPSSYLRSLAPPSPGGAATYTASAPWGMETEQSLTRRLQAEGHERPSREETSKREARDTTKAKATRGAALPKHNSKTSVRGQQQPIDI